MYLNHFKFNELPFSITPNIGFFCSLRGHQEALNTLLFAVRSGEGFIKIVGEVGSGKTLLCRKLWDSLNQDFIIAYLPNPDFNPTELRRAVLRELGCNPTHIADQHELLTAINARLLELHQDNKRVLLLIDEAQVLSRESLEALRLLTNLETDTTKLMQVVLFGQPELDRHLDQNNLRQCKQRISFSYYLPRMSRDDLDKYLFHRLAVAGYTYGALFTEKARKLLFKASLGIPRVVNILCHKALLVAYGQGEEIINHKIMQVAIQDTDVAIKTKYHALIITGISLTLLIGLVFLIYYYKGII